MVSESTLGWVQIPTDHIPPTGGNYTTEYTGGEMEIVTTWDL